MSTHGTWSTLVSCPRARLRVKFATLSAVVSSPDPTSNTDDQLQKDSEMCDIPYGPDQKPWKETLSPWAKSGENVLVTPPSVNPLTFYSFPMGERNISPNLYQVPSTGLEAKQYDQAQTETAVHGAELSEDYLGYQLNLGNDYSVVSSYLSRHTNSGGDPFRSACGNTLKWMERNVLDYYASLWNAKWPHDPNDPETYWGYVLTMGSTEGNLYGLWNARDYLKGKFLTSNQRSCFSVQASENPNAYTPIAFYSQESHYSFIKFMQVLEIKTFYALGTELYPDSCPLGGEWPTEVPCEGGDDWNGPGSIDISKLCKLVDFFTAKGYPALIIFNCGTTIKGAYDDVEKAGEQLMPILERNGMKERLIKIKDQDGRIIQRHCKGYWIHVDGALGASYMPFLHMAATKNHAGFEPAPHFDFKLPFVCSIVTSGHKFPGAPWPTGIYMTKTGLQLSPPSNPVCMDSPDSTLAGSRNGLSVLIWWTYISTHDYDKQVKKVLHSLDLSRYAESQLKQLERERGEDLWVARSPLALTVHFKIPNSDIVYKYTLGKHTISLKGHGSRTYTFLYCMGHTTKEKLDELFEVLHAPDAFPEQPGEVLQRGHGAEI